MTNWKHTLGVVATLGVLGTVGTWMEKSGPGALKADSLLGLPIPLPVSGTVSVNNFPATQNVRVTNSPLAVSFAHPTLVNDGITFSVTMNGQGTGNPPEPELIVPAGVVLTDAHATLSLPQQFQDAAEIFIHSTHNVYYYRPISHNSYDAGVDLQSGILSDGNLRVTMSCINIAGNVCQGALMWSGYQQQ